MFLEPLVIMIHVVSVKWDTVNEKITVKLQKNITNLFHIFLCSYLILMCKR